MDYLLMFVMSILSVCIFLVFIFVLMAIYYGYKQIRDCREDKCKWKKDKDELSGEYTTHCGHVFNDATESGDSVTDWVKYCPYCAGEVKL